MLATSWQVYRSGLYQAYRSLQEPIIRSQNLASHCRRPHWLFPYGLSA